MKIPHVSTGDLLREVVASGSELGKEISAVMQTGGLVSDQLIGTMIKQTVESDKCKNGVLLDGFPRTIAQADMLEKIMAEANRKIDFVIYLSIDLQLVISRLVNRISCKNCGKPFHKINMPPKKEGVCDDCGGPLIQREDDREETIRKRFDTFIEKTQPLIDYYRQKGLLTEIQAASSPKATLDKVLSLMR